ncbi:armadillo-type protein [Mycena metata]|uniref:Armadillo-type protein n=1 Tax=Mycena metata TaxID=1033252 RepID=A0AAD7HK42_9AGAR|nr:armadillo-type protein [Mycena metata]
MVIPGIAELFEAEDEDVRVVAFETVADIAKIQLAEIAKIQLQVAKDKDLRVATVRTAAETAEIQKHINVLAEQRQLLRKTISNIMAMILRALDCTQETQIAALRTLATFSESDDLCDTLNDNVLNKIISGLSQEEEEEDYVTLQTLDTLAVLASKTQFHNNVKGAIRDTLPLLEHWSWRIKQKALSTFVIFARNGILDLGDEITSRMISMLSAGDSDTSASVLNILYSAAKPGHGDGPVMNPDILVATDSLTNPNWHVRVAAFEVLESLANDPSYKKINFPEYATILNCIADEIVEEVQVAGLRTLFRLVDVEIFRDRVAVPETVLNPLIRSSSEDTRISTIGILSSYSTKAKFFSTIQSVIPTIIERLKDTDEDSTIRVTIVQTLCDMVKRDRFWTGSPVFVKHVGDIITSLLHDKDTAVQMAALQVVPVISQHDAFGTTVENSLEVLLPAAHKKEASGAVDETFRIEMSCPPGLKAMN